MGKHNFSLTEKVRDYEAYYEKTNKPLKSKLRRAISDIVYNFREKHGLMRVKFYAYSLGAFARGSEEWSRRPLFYTVDKQLSHLVDGEFKMMLITWHGKEVAHRLKRLLIRDFEKGLVECVNAITGEVYSCNDHNVKKTLFGVKYVYVDRNAKKSIYEEVK